MKTKDYFERGFDIIHKNAKALFDVAETAASMGHFGIGCSLMILSTEESIKATLCSIKFNDPNFPLDHWEEVFKYHKIKHEHIMGMLFVLIIKSEMENNLRKEFRDKMGPIAEEHGLDWDEFEADFYRVLNEKVEFGKEDVLPDINGTALKQWWKKADQLKQAGFYVDKTSTAWKTPETILLADYEQARKYSLQVFGMSRQTMSFYKMHHVPSPKL
jgi:AbiV family abortive infection protein